MQLHSKKAHKVIQEVEKAVIGKDDCVQKVMMAILCAGHILLEDIPGIFPGAESEGTKADLYS